MAAGTTLRSFSNRAALDKISHLPLMLMAFYEDAVFLRCQQKSVRKDFLPRKIRPFPFAAAVVMPSMSPTSSTLGSAAACVLPARTVYRIEHCSFILPSSFCFAEAIMPNSDYCTTLPYQLSSFEKIREEHLIYVDKTPFIEKLERLRKYYAFIVRPRRFGKTLFTSVLEAYYDKSKALDFEKNFKGTYIGAHPTPNQGKYCTLHLEFSGIDPEHLIEEFNTKLSCGFADFFHRYPVKGAESLINASGRLPAQYLLEFFIAVKRSLAEKLFIIIDEYDQFANNILASDPSLFRKITGKDGFLKNFYSQIKEATRTDFVARIFMTGVTVISVDSITSGFSIADDISKHPAFADLFGFTPDELRALIGQSVDFDRCRRTEGEVFQQMRDYYNGYRFCPKTNTTVFNASLCLYYLTSLQETFSEPDPMLDPRSSLDHQRMSGLLALADKEEVKQCFEDVVEGRPLLFGGFSDSLNLNSKNQFDRNDLLSLLFYLGLLTFSPADASLLVCPNRSIRNQFFLYYMRAVKHTPLRLSDEKLRKAVTALQQGDPRPFLNYVSLQLTAGAGLHLYSHFDESNLQTAIKLMAQINAGYRGLVENEALGKGWTDIILKTDDCGIPSYLFELKYLPRSKQKKDTSAAQAALEQAASQLKQYQHAENIQGISRLKKFAVVFVGTELAGLQEVV